MFDKLPCCQDIAGCELLTVTMHTADRCATKVEHSLQLRQLSTTSSCVDPLPNVGCYIHGCLSSHFVSHDNHLMRSHKVYAITMDRGHDGTSRKQVFRQCSFFPKPSILWTYMSAPCVEHCSIDPLHVTSHFGHFCICPFGRRHVGG